MKEQSRGNSALCFRKIQKKLRQKFEKPLDNKQILCYNKDVPSEGRTSSEVKPYGMMASALSPKAKTIHASRPVRAIRQKQGEKNT